jgi:hypothetical protein
MRKSHVVAAALGTFLFCGAAGATPTQQSWYNGAPFDTFAPIPSLEGVCPVPTLECHTIVHFVAPDVAPLDVTIDPFPPGTGFLGGEITSRGSTTVDGTTFGDTPSSSVRVVPATLLLLLGGSALGLIAVRRRRRMRSARQ